jgi:hypothetical protein
MLGDRGGLLRTAARAGRRVLHRLEASGAIENRRHFGEKVAKYTNPTALRRMRLTAKLVTPKEIRKFPALAKIYMARV